MKRLLKRIRELRACNECRSGDWVVTGNGGYARCQAPGCLRGRLLEKADRIKAARDKAEVELRWPIEPSV